MAKKKTLAKAFVGVTAIAVGGKIVYDKYKIVKEKFEKEENESIADDVKKYNAVCTSKSIEIEDEQFTGCEIKAVASKLLLDLSLAVFEKDVYINFKSNASSVTIVLPEGVNAVCDIENVVSGIKNLVVNDDDEDTETVYIIGKSTFSSIEIIPANFYADEEDFEDDDEEDTDTEDEFEDEEDAEDGDDENTASSNSIDEAEDTEEDDSQEDAESDNAEEDSEDTLDIVEADILDDEDEDELDAGSKK